MRCEKARWSARQGSNLRLPHCKCSTRTAELRAVMIARSPLNIGMVSPHVAKLHCTPKRVVNGLARELPLERWWKRSDSNRHVSLCKSGALPIELQSHAGTGSFPKGSRLLEHVLVGGAGIEPAQMTRLQNGGLSLSLTSETGETGRTRTFTSLLKRQLLSQLSCGSVETMIDSHLHPRASQARARLLSFKVKFVRLERLLVLMSKSWTDAALSGTSQRTSCDSLSPSFDSRNNW